MDFAALRKAIEDAETITLFRHQRPDCDALGSQFGLKQWILDQYPDKKVYALGKETTSQGNWPAMDEVSDDVVLNSTAIILDTANTARIDDERACHASFVVKVDHHPNREPFGNLILVDEKAGATCEILGSFFKDQNTDLSVTCATSIYSGLLTDTLCFRTSNTTSHTLEIASYIASYGVNIPELNGSLFDRSLKEFQFANFLRSNYTCMDQHLAFMILTKEMLAEYGIAASEASSFIDEFGHVQEFEIWCIFTQQPDTEDVRFNASLRSKIIPVNDVAEMYNGGGHKNAAGIKNLTEKDINKLLQSLFSKIESAKK